MDIGNDFEVNAGNNKLQTNRNSMVDMNQHLKHQSSTIYKAGSLDIPDTGNRQGGQPQGPQTSKAKPFVGDFNAKARGSKEPPIGFNQPHFKIDNPSN